MLSRGDPLLERAQAMGPLPGRGVCQPQPRGDNKNNDDSSNHITSSNVIANSNITNSNITNTHDSNNNEYASLSHEEWCNEIRSGFNGYRSGGTTCLTPPLYHMCSSSVTNTIAI